MDEEFDARRSQDVKTQLLLIKGMTLLVGEMAKTDKSNYVVSLMEGLLCQRQSLEAEAERQHQAAMRVIKERGGF